MAVATPGRSLSELSSSETNARATANSDYFQESRLTKHKTLGLPEPTAKRKQIQQLSKLPVTESDSSAVSAAAPKSRLRLPQAAGSASTLSTSMGHSRLPLSASIPKPLSTQLAQSRNTDTLYNKSSSVCRSPRPQTAMSRMRPAFAPQTASSYSTTSTQRKNGDDRQVTENPNNGMAGSSSSSRQFFKRQTPISCNKRAISSFLSQSMKISPRKPPKSIPLASESLFCVEALDRLDLGSTAHEATSCNRVKEYNKVEHFPSQISTPSNIKLSRQNSPSVTFQSLSLSPIQSRTSEKQLSPNKTLFLTKASNVTAPAWDTQGRIENVEFLYGTLAGKVEQNLNATGGFQEVINLQKAKLAELESAREELLCQNRSLQIEIEQAKSRLSCTNGELDETRRSYKIRIEDLERKSRHDVEDLMDSAIKDKEAIENNLRLQMQALIGRHQIELEKLAVIHKESNESMKKNFEMLLSEEKKLRLDERERTQTESSAQRHQTEASIIASRKETESLRTELLQTRSDLEQQKSLTSILKSKLSELGVANITIESSMRAMKAKIDFLESDNQAQSQSFADLNQKMQDAVEAAALAQEKLRKEETLRRKLFNRVQELKGNIRVFCRVRPTFDEEEMSAKITYPDSNDESKEMTIKGPDQRSALGTVIPSSNAFSFDRVFGPKVQNGEIFDEISQLVQSALDGYNVCIFCYGQTGSGKTFTMSSADGMIQRAVRQIFETTSSLKEKCWSYTMEGSFVEVYNENLNDLLGKAEELDKKKCEIKHDIQQCRTIITDVNTVVLETPVQLERMMQRANANRSVAATKANERSSRSHSVFILKLKGENSVTGEKCEGTLNLVDLAGSERLSHSGATGERLRETQSINRSLSCLGDVINALGQGKEGAHIPYRNSKLTYLLQLSLGGNSKTLMLVMVSPLQTHLNETLTSLKFATKVQNTHIGTARRQTKIKD